MRAIRRIAVFLAVVWSIGGVFLALEAGMTELSWFGSSKVLPAKVVPPAQSRAAALHCQEALKRLVPHPLDAGVSRQASYLAWKLGYFLGSADALVSAGAASRPEVESALKQSLPMTDGLGVPALALPPQEHSAYALRDFNVFISEDPQCVAAALEFSYSLRHASLYKFGAVVGFNSIYRQRAPELGDVLAPEIRAYGTAAGIPPNLYALLLQRSPPGGAPAVRSAVDRIDNYIRTAY